MMTPGSRHTAAKSTQRLLLARRVNFLVTENDITAAPWKELTVHMLIIGLVPIQPWQVFAHISTLFSGTTNNHTGLGQIVCTCNCQKLIKGRQVTRIKELKLGTNVQDINL